MGINEWPKADSKKNDVKNNKPQKSDSLEPKLDNSEKIKKEWKAKADKHFETARHLYYDAGIFNEIVVKNYSQAAESYKKAGLEEESEKALAEVREYIKEKHDMLKKWRFQDDTKEIALKYGIDLRPKIKKTEQEQAESERTFEGRTFVAIKKFSSYVEKGHEAKLFTNYVVSSLAGFDSEEAWAMREKLLKNGTDKGSIAQGLAGLDSDRAWAMREELLKKGANEESVSQSLAGVDSDRAWAMREKLLKNGTDKPSIADSLIGLDSDRAWVIREKLFEENDTSQLITEKICLALSLAGLDSDRAWAMREKLLKEEGSFVAQGLAGVDSARAWVMREKLLKNGTDKGSIALSLAGLDSEEAWAMREKLIDIGCEQSVAEGLAGLDSEEAWDMRQELLSKGVEEKYIVSGINGDYLTAIAWRAKRDRELNKK